MSSDPKLGYVFLNSSEYGAIGWIEDASGFQGPYDQRSVYGSPVNSKFWDRRSTQTAN